MFRLSSAIRIQTSSTRAAFTSRSLSYGPGACNLVPRFPSHINARVQVHACMISKRHTGTSGQEHAELQRQIGELTSLCTALSKKVDDLQTALEDRTPMLEHLTQIVESRTTKNLLDVCTVKNGKPADRANFVPTLDMVANQVNQASQLDNDSLAMLAIAGDGFARRERLLREIMWVEQCSWDDAHDILTEMDEYNEQKYWIQTAPFRLGIAGALIGVVASCLLVFNKTVAYEYGSRIAGEELPEGTDNINQLTYNQVGSWTWTWMEPMIGTASFVLLCAQFMRAQCIRINMQPYRAAMLKWRGARVTKQYPQYDGSIVRAWSQVMPAVGYDFMPKYKRRFYTKEARRQNFRGGV